MPMEIDRRMWRRREWLAAALAAAAGPAITAPATRPPRLAAGWATERGQQLGVLTLHAGRVAVQARLDIPTRAHGLWVEPHGTLLSVARRPGDWLLRWHPDGRALAWCWIEPDRAYNGHVLLSADRRTLYTTETDLSSGQGLIGVRNARSLEKLAEWPTAGADPHELLRDAAGRLLVANGGIATRPETGRAKLDLEHMDSSLVCLDPRHGSLLGQWRLADRRLSLRHLARLADGTLGIALQAEHEHLDVKQAAPVLALFDGRELRTAPLPDGVSMSGYGGDIAALGNRFAVSSPRAGRVALWEADGRPVGHVPLAEACALSSTGEQLWSGGRAALLDWTGRGAGQALPLPARETLRLDNHWVVLPPA
ncbi:DUF1513 domain-containing protein [Aquabacterium sp. A7-Y]|uniref:DUF1513 domain-containing protein n=1 Tax=Aquabacterium sp. A7-Y TaxID=1349605 RepID=UPI00223C97B9|nr:DUF1513 domain-containing protein [Aquabacterium sp. A7-Y]MCW7539214.1 DUF1513 domain-containing protein [Aquabacterium sp. A7-Y]